VDSPSAISAFPNLTRLRSGADAEGRGGGFVRVDRHDVGADAVVEAQGLDAELARMREVGADVGAGDGLLAFEAVVADEAEVAGEFQETGLLRRQVEGQGGSFAVAGKAVDELPGAILGHDPNAGAEDSVRQDAVVGPDDAERATDPAHVGLAEPEEEFLLQEMRGEIGLLAAGADEPEVDRAEGRERRAGQAEEGDVGVHGGSV